MTVQAIEKTVSNIIKTSLCKKAKSASKIAVAKTGQHKPVTELTDSTSRFIRVDKSLNPEFLKGLLKIEGKTPLDTYTKIKDEILKAMGFKHPEALKVSLTNSEDAIAEFMFKSGEIHICDTKLPKEEIIATLRHELDHMEKFVKIYKSSGKETFAKAIIAYRKLNGVKTPENTEEVLKHL